MGRQRVLQMFPLSILELVKNYKTQEINENIPNYLRFGMYPEVLLQKSDHDKKEILRELVDSYLFKDIFNQTNIKNPLVVKRLLTMLAYQVGRLVSHNELAKRLQIDSKTVATYLDLLTQCFIITPLGGYSRNLRNEITKMNKYYFTDVGIRNALIGDFNAVDIRGDIGGLFENFAYMEMLKKQKYNAEFVNNYFWRRNNNQEIDLICEFDGKIIATEFKYSNQQVKKVKIPNGFAKEYQVDIINVITTDNIIDKLTGG